MFIDDNESQLESANFEVLFEQEYKSQEAYHRIIQDLNSEVETRDSYKGREILEMLQNAEDQKSSFFFISVDTSVQTICFYNGGMPFSKKGFDAILYAKTSPKEGNLSSIGNKGLGFRSILNWAESVDIYSRHTHVSFSVDIAKQKWDDLRKFFSEHELGNNIKEIQSNMNRLRGDKHEINVPLSVFAVPKAMTYEELPKEFSECDENIATVIKVKYKSELQKGILGQIKSINNESLLFINNITKIIIKIDDGVTTIRKELSKKEPWNEGFVYKYTITNGEKTDRYSVYMEDGVYKEYEKEIEEYTEEDNYLNPKLTKKKITERYQIGIAIVESSNSKTNDSVNTLKSFPLYSFFETQVETNLPCILHGSFSLSPDRKQLQDQSEYNIFLQNKLGQKFVQFVEFFAKKRQEDGFVDWFPFDQIKTLNNSSVSSELNLFKQEMDKALLEASIYPSIDNGYCKLKDTIAYTESFAKLIQEKPIYVEAGLGKHLLCGFVERAVRCNKDEHFDLIINKLSLLINEKYEKNTLVEDCYTERVALIDFLREIKYMNNGLKILTDENHCLLIGSKEERLYINTGTQLVNPPSFLHFQYIDKALIKALCEKWQDILKPLLKTHNNDEKRALADFLDNQLGLSYVSAADIARIKEKIVNILHNKPSLEEYKILIKCLYESFQKDPDINFLNKTENGLSYYRDENNTYKDAFGEKVKKLMLMSADCDYHSSMSIILYDKDFPHGLEKVLTERIENRWKLWGTVKEWKSIFEDDNVQRIEDFFVKVLGVALYVPLSLYGFSENELVKQAFFWNKAFVLRSCSQDHYCAWYVSDSYKYNDFYNLSFTPDRIFLQGLKSFPSWCKLLALFLKSEYIYKSFLQKSIRYRYQKALGTDILKFSFTACFINNNGLFDAVKDVVIESNLDLVHSIMEESGRSLADVENILVQLGASRTLNDLTIPSLYKLLDATTEKFQKGERISIQSEYKKIRKYILSKSKGDDRTLQECSAKIKKLVAKKENKLSVFPKEEIYYWDSDEYPQALLNTLPKLEIGSKVGEQSVEKIFWSKTY